MSRYDRPAFNPAGAFEARRAFTYNGKKYTPGQSFLWRKIACSPRKLRDLFNGNFITVAKSAKPAKKKAEKRPEKKAEKKPEKKAEKKAEKKPEKTVEAPSSDKEIEEFLNDQSD